MCLCVVIDLRHAIPHSHLFVVLKILFDWKHRKLTHYKILTSESVAFLDVEVIRLFYGIRHFHIISEKACQNYKLFDYDANILLKKPFSWTKNRFFLYLQTN